MKSNTLQNLRSQLFDGNLSVCEIVNYYLEQIDTYSSLNAYIEVWKDEALQKASELDHKITNGKEVGKLAGAVFSVKDVICVEDKIVTGASKILDNYRSPFNATVIDKILQEDGILIGRTNCDEFAMGSDNRNSFYGPALNKLGEDKVPGGSSGGAAVSIQIDSCLVALGSDTGGSVRQPAAFTGTIGIKPTYGRLSRYGLLAYASSFDQIGLIGNHPEDLLTTLNIISGTDINDGTVSPTANEAISATIEAKLKLGIMNSGFDHHSMDPEIRTFSKQFIEKTLQDKYTVENAEFDLIDYVIPTYYILTSAEASANLSRYDGVRYGYRAENVKSLNELYTKSRTQGFGKEVKRRIITGTYVLSSGYYDAYYKRGQQARRILVKKIKSLMEEFDAIICPITPKFPWSIDEKISPVELYMSDIFSVLPNLTGFPAISIPIGTSQNGYPIGIQIISNSWEEGKLLKIAQDVL